MNLQMLRNFQRALDEDAIARQMMGHPAADQEPDAFPAEFGGGDSMLGDLALQGMGINTAGQTPTPIPNSAPWDVGAAAIPNAQRFAPQATALLSGAAPPANSLSPQVHAPFPGGSNDPLNRARMGAANSRGEPMTDYALQRFMAANPTSVDAGGAAVPATTRNSNLNYLQNVGTGPNDPGAPGWRGQRSTDLAFGPSGTPIVTRGDRAAAESALTAAMLARHARENPEYRNATPTENELVAGAIAAVPGGSGDSPASLFRPGSDPDNDVRQKYLAAVKAFNKAVDNGADPSTLPKVPGLFGSPGEKWTDEEALHRRQAINEAKAGNGWEQRQADKKQAYGDRQMAKRQMRDLQRQGMHPMQAAIAAGIVDPATLDPRIALQRDEMEAQKKFLAQRGKLMEAQADREAATGEAIRGAGPKAEAKENQEKVGAAYKAAGDDWEAFERNAIAAGVPQDVIDREGARLYPGKWRQPKPQGGGLNFGTGAGGFFDPNNPDGIFGWLPKPKAAKNADGSVPAYSPFRTFGF